MDIKSFFLSTVLLCTVPFTVYAADWNPLPDTGQTTCYDVAGNVITCPTEGQPLYGQDAQYDGPALAYQDNGNGTVTDLNSGLMWQQADDGTIRTWEAAGAYCDSLSLGFHDDWRLPERIELKSIADFGRSYPSIDPVFSCQSSDYWSATTVASNSSDAWMVYFCVGGGFPKSKTDSFFVRCVRAGL